MTRKVQKKKEEIYLLKTQFGHIEVFLRQDGRSKKTKIKINQNGKVTLLYAKKYKRKFFQNLQKKALISFLKLHRGWVVENREKVLVGVGGSAGAGDGSQRLPSENTGRAKSSKTNITFTRKEFLKNKEVLRALAKERVEFFNSHYNFSYNRISIKNQKTRWGSCSSKNNLNFNISILRLPKELQDLIFVHELCHLKEMNHKKAFWSLVQEQIPNYKKLNKKLNEYSINKVD